MVLASSSQSPPLNAWIALRTGTFGSKTECVTWQIPTSECNRLSMAPVLIAWSRAFAMGEARSERGGCGSQKEYGVVAGATRP